LLQIINDKNTILFLLFNTVMFSQDGFEVIGKAQGLELQREGGDYSLIFKDLNTNEYKTF